MLVSLDLNIQRIVLQWPLTFLPNNRHIRYTREEEYIHRIWSFYDRLLALFSLSLTHWQRLCMILGHHDTVEIIIIITNIIIIIIIIIIIHSGIMGLNGRNSISGR